MLIRFICDFIYIIPYFLLVIAIGCLIIGRKSIILLIMALELILLCVLFNYIIYGYCTYAQFKSIVFGILTLTIGAAESAIGLALTIAYHKLKKFLF